MRVLQGVGGDWRAAGIRTRCSTNRSAQSMEVQPWTTLLRRTASPSRWAASRFAARLSPSTMESGVAPSTSTEYGPSSAAAPERSDRISTPWVSSLNTENCLAGVPMPLRVGVYMKMSARRMIARVASASTESKWVSMIGERSETIQVALRLWARRSISTRSAWSSRVFRALRSFEATRRCRSRR